MVGAEVLVELHQRKCLFSIRAKPFKDQVFSIIGPMNQAFAANIADGVRLRNFTVLVVNLSAPGTHQTADQTLFFSKALRVRSDFDNGKAVAYADLRPERFRLRDGARVTIEDEPVLAI